MAAKKKDMMDQVLDKVERSQTYNPLLKALRENDKKNLFETNVVTVFHKTGFPVFDYFFGSVINMHDENGNIIRQEPRIGQAAGTFNLIVGGSGSGKMEPVSRLLPVPEGGTKRMGDLQVGDKIFGSDGKPITVTGIFPHGKQYIYKITFSDGRIAQCGLDHLWKVIIESHGRDIEKILPLSEMFKDYKRRDDDSHRRYRIPALSSPVEYEHKDVPIDPYVLGAFIGNGCCTLDRLTISCGSNFIPLKIAKIYGFDVKRKSRREYSWMFYKDGHAVKTKEFFKDVPEICDYSYNKYIPDNYLYNSLDIRMELLRGLLDTDGTINRAIPRFTISYSSTSKKLLNQIKELIQGLGFNGNINVDKRFHKYTNKYSGTLIFQMPNDIKHKFFYLPYKLDRALEAASYENRRNYEFITIREIEFSHMEEARCISVDASDKLYLTEDFIVTHNTTLSAQISGNIIRQHPFANVIHFDCENRFDISRAENITKLPSTYFDPQIGERYMIKSGMVGLDTIQEMIVKTYINKMKLRKELEIDSGFIDEFGKPIITLQPTVVIIDSITTVINETLNPDNAKEAKDAESLRGNTEGARDAKTMKGFLKEVLPMCKEAGITIYGINHINTNMSMNAFTPVAKSQINLKQDEIIPGGKSLVFYSFNIIKLIPKASDNFTEETDGFVGHIVAVEPIKSSSNVSGNNSKGVSFEMVFDFKKGFDSLRTTVLYGRDKGIIEGNKPRMKFKDDDSFTFSWKNIYQEAKEKPIWENLKKYVIPELEKHLSFINIEEKFDDRSLDY